MTLHELEMACSQIHAPPLYVGGTQVKMLYKSSPDLAI